MLKIIQHEVSKPVHWRYLGRPGLRIQTRCGAGRGTEGGQLYPDRWRGDIINRYRRGDFTIGPVQVVARNSPPKWFAAAGFQRHCDWSVRGRRYHHRSPVYGVSLVGLDGLARLSEIRPSRSLKLSERFLGVNGRHRTRIEGGDAVFLHKKAHRSEVRRGRGSRGAIRPKPTAR